MTGPERAVCPPDHAHGATSTCYTVHRCGCAPCLEARVEYQYWRRGMTAAGRFVNPYVDARGVRRRLEALIALGHSMPRIAVRLGVGHTQTQLWLAATRVHRKTVALVDAVYEHMSIEIPVVRSKADRISVRAALTYAARRGFVPPLAWDDIDTDKHPPHVGPDSGVDVIAIELAIEGTRVHLTAQERALAVDGLTARGTSAAEIALLLGVTSKTIERDRAALAEAAA